MSRSDGRCAFGVAASVLMVVGLVPAVLTGVMLVAQDLHDASTPLTSSSGGDPSGTALAMLMLNFLSLLPLAVAGVLGLVRLVAIEATWQLGAFLLLGVLTLVAVVTAAVIWHGPGGLWSGSSGGLESAQLLQDGWYAAVAVLTMVATPLLLLPDARQRAS